MRWLELITIRTARENHDELIDFCKKRVAEFHNEPGLVVANMHSNSEFDTDYSIALIWDKPGPVEKSRAALLLAEHLSAFGIVIHTLWNQELPEDEEIHE